VKLLIEQQILGCELHKNAFGGLAPPGPAGGATALPQTPSRYKGEGRVGNGEGEEGEGMEGREEIRRGGKGKGGMERERG